MEHKLSVWTNYFPGLKPEEKLEAFSRCGYHYAELSTECGDVLLSRGDPCREGEAYQKRARDLGIELLQGHLDLRADILNAAHVDALKTWLDLFQAVGVRNCVLHYGQGPAVNLPPRALLTRRAAALRQLAQHINGTGMAICLENISSSYDGDCAVLLELIDEAGGENLGICLDTGHLHLAGGSPGQFILQAGTHLKALHIADNEGYYDQHLMPFGRGTVDWTEFMQALNKSGYTGLFNFEIPGESGAPQEVLEHKLCYIRKVAYYMATLG